MMEGFTLKECKKMRKDQLWNVIQVLDLRLKEQKRDINEVFRKARRYVEEGKEYDLKHNPRIIPRQWMIRIKVELEKLI